MSFKYQPLSTDRLLLRKLSLADLPELMEIYAEPDIMKAWGMHPLTDEADIQKIITDANDAILTGKSITLGVIEKHSSKLIGLVLLFNIVDSSNRAEIGYALNKRVWRNGYMREALSGFIRYLFMDNKFRRLEADINPSNVASEKLLLQLGFKKEGLLKNRWEFNNQTNDSEIYGLLNPYWK